MPWHVRDNAFIPSTEGARRIEDATLFEDHASNLEEVRRLVTNEQSSKCLEEEL